MARSTTKSNGNSSNNSSNNGNNNSNKSNNSNHSKRRKPTAHSQQPTRTTAPERSQGESSPRPFGYGAWLVLVAWVGGEEGGVVFLGEVKARPIDIISFSLDYISKSKVQTSNPSSSPTSLDTPARPAEYMFSCENPWRATLPWKYIIRLFSRLSTCFYFFL